MPAPVHFRHPAPPSSGFGAEHTLCGCARSGPAITDDVAKVTCKSCMKGSNWRIAVGQATGALPQTRPVVFRCARCEADPIPAHSGPRQCAFDERGRFTPDNWRCATLDALTRVPWLDVMQAAWVYGQDESLQPIPAFVLQTDPDDPSYTMSGSEGFIVLSRYKTRGKVSSAMHVGDFWPAKPLTLAFAERVLDYAAQRAAELAQT